MTSLYGNIGDSIYAISSAFGNVSGSQKEIFAKTKRVYVYARKRQSISNSEVYERALHTAGSGWPMYITNSAVYFGTGVTVSGTSMKLTGAYAMTSQEDMDMFMEQIKSSGEDFYTIHGWKEADMLTHYYPAARASYTYLTNGIMMYASVANRALTHSANYVHDYSEGFHVVLNNSAVSGCTRYNYSFNYYDSSYNTLYETFETTSNSYYTGMTDGDFIYEVDE